MYILSCPRDYKICVTGLAISGLLGILKYLSGLKITSIGGALGARPKCEMNSRTFHSLMKETERNRMLVSQEADLNFILPSLYFAKFLRNPLTSTEKLSQKKKQKKNNKTKQNNRCSDI